MTSPPHVGNNTLMAAMGYTFMQMTNLCTLSSDVADQSFMLMTILYILSNAMQHITWIVVGYTFCFYSQVASPSDAQIPLCKLLQFFLSNNSGDIVIGIWKGLNKQTKGGSLFHAMMFLPRR